MTVAIIAASEIRDKLSAFAPTMEGSSLYLLRAIEQTVDSLQAEEQLAKATVEVATKLAAEIRASDIVRERYLDPDDTSINGIEAGYKALEEYLPKMLVKKASIDHDGHLDGEQCELLHTAYDRCIDTIASLIEAAKDLRAAVIAHDLTAEPEPATYDSSGALVSALHNS